MGARGLQSAGPLAGVLRRFVRRLFTVNVSEAGPAASAVAALPAAPLGELVGGPRASYARAVPDAGWTQRERDAALLDQLERRRNAHDQAMWQAPALNHRRAGVPAELSDLTAAQTNCGSWPG
jgi:hypothetical protein